MYLFDSEVKDHHKQAEGKHNIALPALATIESIFKDLNKVLGWDAQGVYSGSGEVTLKVTRFGRVYEDITIDIWDSYLANMIYNRLMAFEAPRTKEREHNSLRNLIK